MNGLSGKNQAAADTITALMQSETWAAVADTVKKASEGNQVPLGATSGMLAGIILPGKKVPGGLASKAESVAADLGKTGTVFDSIKETQPVYPGSVIPKSFEMTLPNGQRVWVHGNATEHMAEDAASKAVANTPEAVKLASQTELRSFQATLDTAIKNGMPYGRITVDGWQLEIKPPRTAGELPTIIHARYLRGKLMDIEITSPIHIIFDVIELDRHIPSLKFDLAIQVNKYNYSLSVSSQVWLECQCFDEFICNIRNDDIAHLSDMNGCFELMLNPVLGWFEWSCTKEDLDGYITVSKGREKLTIDAKSAIYTVFNNYPKWW